MSGRIALVTGGHPRHRRWGSRARSPRDGWDLVLGGTRPGTDVGPVARRACDRADRRPLRGRPICRAATTGPGWSR